MLRMPKTLFGKRLTGLHLFGSRKAGKWLGGGIAVLVIANEVRGVLMVAAISSELWRNMIAGG